jgi:hypothetical protein
LAKFVVIKKHLSCLFHLAVNFLGMRADEMLEAEITPGGC